MKLIDKNFDPIVNANVELYRYHFSLYHHLFKLQKKFDKEDKYSLIISPFKIRFSLKDKSICQFYDVENDFAKDKLSRDNLFAFEERAVQKLKDLADYLNIYSNYSLPKEFRLQARQIIQESFESEKVMQDYYQNLNLVEDSVAGILFYSEKAVMFKTEIDSIIITDYFHKNTSSGYAGQLQFSQKISAINSNDKVLVNIHKYNFEIILSKTKKQFGNESHIVWTLSFGGIE